MKNKKTLAAITWTALSVCTLFTPLDAAWGPVMTISDPTVESANQGIAIDNFCRATATWETSEEPTEEISLTAIQSASLLPGGAWSTPPTTITTFLAPPFSAFASISMNPTGYTVEAWGKYNESIPYVGPFFPFPAAAKIVTTQGSTQQFGGSWAEPPAAASSGLLAADGVNTVVINANGYAMLIFYSKRIGTPYTINNPFTVYTATLAPGSQTWSAPIAVLTSPHGSQGISLDANGNGYVSGQPSDTFPTSATPVVVPFEIFTLPFGATAWSAPVTITPNSDFGTASVVLDNAGNQYAVWVFNDTLLSSTFPVGATSWTAPVDIADNIVIATLPSPSFAQLTPLLIVNPNTGDQTVIYETLINNVNTILSASRPFGQTVWNAPIIAGPTLAVTDGNLSLPSPSVDNCGNIIMVWPNLVNGGYVVQASILYSLGNAWSPVTTISSPGVDSILPAGIASPNGYTVVTWLNADTVTIQGAVYTPPATTVLSLVADSTGTTATINGNGFCGVTSVQFGSANANFTINSGTSITVTIPAGVAGTTTTVTVSSGCNADVSALYTYPPSSPVNFIGCIKKNKFFDKTECFLETTWTASSSTNVVAYNIYKGSTLVATVAAGSSLSYDKKLSKKSKCKASNYSITAVDQFGQQSAPVSLTLVK